MNGLEIVRRVYTRLRRPSQEALPHKTVLETVAEVVARRKLDLALSPQNSLATTSQWFTPSSQDFPLSDLGIHPMLPIRMERRAVDSEYATGDPVDIVNYEVLDTHPGGDAVSFYGDPMRISFREPLDRLYEQQFRIVYEADSGLLGNLNTMVGLPDAFRSLIVVEAAMELLPLVEDASPEWAAFVEMNLRFWPSQIMEQRLAWDRYVGMFKGRASVPKRTFHGNRSGRVRTRWFKG